MCSNDFIISVLEEIAIQGKRSTPTTEESTSLQTMNTTVDLEQKDSKALHSSTSALTTSGKTPVLIRVL